MFDNEPPFYSNHRQLKEVSHRAALDTSRADRQDDDGLSYIDQYQNLKDFDQDQILMESIDS